MIDLELGCEMMRPNSQCARDWRFVVGILVGLYRGFVCERVSLTAITIVN